MKTRTKIILSIILFGAPIIALFLGARWAYLALGKDYSIGALEVTTAWVLGGIIGFTLMRAKRKHKLEAKGDTQTPQDK